MAKKAVSSYSKYNPEAKRRKKVNPLKELYPPLPGGKYDVIYADPPWDYGGKMQYDKSSIKAENIGFEKAVFISAANFKYPTLKLRDLKELGVASIAADDCLLFMWTTGPQMANSIELGQSWGFEYKTLITWIKTYKDGTPEMGMGYYFRGCTEHIIFGIKGKKRTINKVTKNMFMAVNPKLHSEKPPIMRDMIVKCSGDIPRIELFARQYAEGWDCWGDEV